MPRPMRSAASKVRRLSGGQRQAVVIARAAGRDSKIVIMDEPTAAFGVQETARVEQVVRTLRDSGVAVLLTNDLAIWRNLWDDGPALARHVRDYMANALEVGRVGV